MNIGVFLGSIREGRTGIDVATWVMQQLHVRADGHTYHLIDLVEQDLNPNNAAEPKGVKDGAYADEKTRAWAKLMDGFDAFIFVTAEYNASVPGPLKDAFDLLFAEWTGKLVALVGYGSDGASTSRKHWADIFNRVGMKLVSTQAGFSFKEHFPEATFIPGEPGGEWVNSIADELTAA
ncbi:NAD(P)H-dependent oxidoreductase [Corynebacterium sanguinis]|uniref:NADPH-dependent FMN reductase n=1 Tax=Corynebacterium sanguinis TaxID=2594913 RepID=UPI0011A5185F|nr:NAD(P)H-dependent oxidoreductase [Corynebacterium sanguinis]MCT2047576.1 NAD(P)H-dependent oxidoreductase [Corynebacterium sanguinis]MDN8578133.1 NAD(P)H-dependent oxidoreductase [Corynebacterium sanguinis]TVS24732.1 NADPH-dependent oxidoreductase [Corynebacterium sanguinis]